MNEFKKSLKENSKKKLKGLTTWQFYKTYTKGKRKIKYIKIG